MLSQALWYSHCMQHLSYNKHFAASIQQAFSKHLASILQEFCKNFASIWKLTRLVAWCALGCSILQTSVQARLLQLNWSTVSQALLGLWSLQLARDHVKEKLLNKESKYSDVSSIFSLHICPLNDMFQIATCNHENHHILVRISDQILDN